MPVMPQLRCPDDDNVDDTRLPRGDVVAYVFEGALFVVIGSHLFSQPDYFNNFNKSFG